MDLRVRVTKWFFLTWSIFLFSVVKGRAQLDESAGEVDIAVDDCECTVYYQCSNKYGRDLIRPRRQAIKHCERIEEICCPVEPTPPLSRIKNYCGIRNTEGIGFKVFKGEDTTLGEDTVLGEFPWMVAIMSVKDGVEKFECGGSLIHSQVVMTAAHCVEKIAKGDLVSRGGAWDFRTDEQIRPQQNRKAQKIFIHKDYEKDKDTALHDIALLILEEPYTDAENIGIICLPTQEETVYEDCIVTGWGKNDTGGVFQQGLKSVKVPIVPRDKCEALLRETRLGKMLKQNESFICAGGGGANVCEGDEGGPLICPIKGVKQMQYQQVGILSWGTDCGETPAVYINVVLFIDWIKEQMDKVKLQLSY